MRKITFGNTAMEFEKNGFGALPLQRLPLDEAVRLLRRALDGGITFFDTARSYSDSEEKLGAAFDACRERVLIATKTPAQSAADFWEDLRVSLATLRTDYIDLYQLHNPSFLPVPGGADGLYDALLEAKAQGKIRHIGITNHSLPIAQAAIDSGLYESLQFPFNYLSAPDELELPARCADVGMGFIAMKAMSGGLLQSGRAPFAFFESVENAVPIWGIQRESELDEFLALMQSPPALDASLKAVIAADCASLQGSFCRGCGYCLPCPADIEINNAARISLMLRRAVSADWVTPEWRAKMERVKGCLHCGQCSKKCPYHLDTPALLERNYEDYQKYLAALDEGMRERK